MISAVAHNETNFSQIRLFLEEICCELCRFRHVADGGFKPEEIKVSREANLDAPESFADIRVQVPGAAPYVVEVKFGYSEEQLVSHLSRKYGTRSNRTAEADRLVLLIQRADYSNWPDVEAKLRSTLVPNLKLEIWDEDYLVQLIHERFGVKIDAISGGDLLAVRDAIDDAKWRHAFGDRSERDPLGASLLWHFGFWKLRQLHEEHGFKPRDILRSGLYRGVAVLIADLCSFSSYVRDTPDDEQIRYCLTSFYSKARYAILNTGGMMYQFVGDEVIGLFGLPSSADEDAHNTLECAQALIDIGNSVSNQWQRELDRVQESKGVHIGIAVGDLNLMPLRPFFASHVGFIGDPLNLAARLTSEAGSGEIAVSNSFYQRLDAEAREPFEELQPIEAKNVGMIRSWKLAVR